jgi:hypothetical protein
MASDYQGYGTAHSVKKEAVWGTPVTPTEKLEVISSSLNSNVPTAPRPVLFANASGMPRKHHQLRNETGGPAVYPMKFSGLGYILEAIFGAVATTGTGPYDHTYTLGDQASLPSLTIEEILGTSAGAYTYAGMKVNRAEFSWTAGDIGRINVDYIGEDETGPAPPTSLTIDAGNVIEGWRGGSLGWNSDTYCLNSLSITIDNGLERRDKICGLTTKEPQPTRQRSVMVRLSLDVDDALRTAQLANTQGNATITFTGTGNEALAIVIQNAYLASTSDPKTSHGTIEMTVEMMAEDDDTDAGLEFVITNDQANYYD